MLSKMLSRISYKKHDSSWLSIPTAKQIVVYLLSEGHCWSYLERISQTNGQEVDTPF